MIPAAFGTAPKTVLILGAHCDDIEIGCGGTILRLIENAQEIEIHWVVLSGSDQRERETRRAAETLIGGRCRFTVDVQRFRNGYFPQSAGDIKEFFESLKPIAPDLIFTHYHGDLHQDHRIASELTWNTFRSHAIWEYEIPKYDGDLGNPNLFVALTPKQLELKVQALLSCFPSQRDKHWFDEDMFKALARLRGGQAGAAFAEAFYCRKQVFDP